MVIVLVRSIKLHRGGGKTPRSCCLPTHESYNTMTPLSVTPHDVSRIVLPTNNESHTMDILMSSLLPGDNDSQRGVVATPPLLPTNNESHTMNILMSSLLPGDNDSQRGVVLAATPPLLVAMINHHRSPLSTAIESGLVTETKYTLQCIRKAINSC